DALRIDDRPAAGQRDDSLDCGCRLRDANEGGLTLLQTKRLHAGVVGVATAPLGVVAKPVASHARVAPASRSAGWNDNPPVCPHRNITAHRIAPALVAPRRR